MAKKKSDKENYDKMPDFDDIDNMIEIEDVDDDEVEEEEVIQKGKKSCSTLKPGKVVALRKQGKMKQTNINDKLDEEKRAQACQYIGRLFYLAGIPFNVACLDEFKWAVEAIGQYGPNMKPPSYHELRVPILKKEIGEANVVQVVLDNGSNYALAGKLLEAKRPNLYWTPCAAHCIDLILEDIGKIPRIAKTLERAIQLTRYIYNHGGVLNMMREYTKQRELVRAGKTRFCTSYLTIISIYKQQHNLRAMFTSEEWVRSRWAKEAIAKRVVKTILMPSFWNTIVYILKVMGPLFRVLHLVDNERKPAMGYIYEAMNRAKEAIINLLMGMKKVGHFLNPEYFYFDPNIATNYEIPEGLYACIQRLVPSAEI
ncbi:hypothetical protein SO802_004478 [Lithocarpus litseifolius]|uniref:DUF659 domain-containing protein n=1 Tax=Lithocarpus litseifolius TaxID=425828 RepID=A0AAW2E724_9ROSI